MQPVSDIENARYYYIILLHSSIVFHFLLFASCYCILLLHYFSLYGINFSLHYCIAFQFLDQGSGYVFIALPL